jgi:hypothetical protein
MCRNQQITGFQLATVWSTTLRSMIRRCHHGLAKILSQATWTSLRITLGTGPSCFSPLGDQRRKRYVGDCCSAAAQPPEAWLGRHADERLGL